MDGNLMVPLKSFKPTFAAGGSGGSALPGTLMAKVDKILKEMEYTQKIELISGKWYLTLYDVDDVTLIAKCELQTVAGAVIGTPDSTKPSRRLRTSVTTYGAAITGDMMSKINKLMAHKFFLKSIEELPAGSGQYYETVYDSDGVTLLSKCLLQNYVGDNIGSMLGTTTPAIRQKTVVSVE